MSKHPNVEAIHPLSPTQQGMLFHSLYSPGSGVYTVQVCFTLAGPLDGAVLARAWQGLVDRHPVLRTAFPWDRGSKPVQAVLSAVALPWEEHDLRALPLAERRQSAEALRRAERERGFDLARAPLLRLVLVRLEDELHELLWSYHHLLFDGWSLPILLRDVTATHAALCRGAAVELPPVRPYGGYIAWLQRQDAAAAETFWRSELAGFTSPTPLPLTPPGAAEERAEAHGERVTELPAAATAALQAWARRRRLTLNTVVQGAWALLLSAVSGEDDVVFGVTTAGRPAALEGVESMVGLFINTLPARVRVPLEAPLAGWLQELQARQLEVRRHEHSALPQVQQWSEVARGTPLFESLFVFENFPADDSLRHWGGGVELRDLAIRDSSNYPVTVAVGVAPALVLRILWDRARSDAAAIDRMLGHLRCLLEGMAAAPDRLLEAFALLTAPEEEQLVREWNDAATDFPRASLAELFAAQARMRPDDLAVVFGDEILTYGELDLRANRLAHHLIALGVRPGDLVAVCLERSAALVTSVLGIIKAGAAYVPLDPDHPVERLALMLAETRAAALVTRGDLQALLATPGLATVLLDDPEDPVARQSGGDPARRVPAGAPAYVMYTSGSTGRPKGIIIPQEAVVRLVLETDYVRLTPSDRIAQASNASFDAATFEIWGALLNGARLVGVSRDTVLSPRRLAAAIAGHGLTTLFLTTALFNQVAQEVPDGFRPLSHLLFGGQAVDPGRVRDVLAAGPPARLLHVYGPTESTTYASWYRIGAVAPDAATVPIGRPLANTELLVLDRAGRPAPLGAPGELYVGGEGLARGYLGRPDLTAERFLPHPWRRGERLYRTGDLARRSSRGDVEFLGRVDHQVKIRGFRVEPAEVEVALARHGGVREVTVVARADGPGEKRLVAYVVPAAAAAPGVAELRAFLQERLPDFLIPAAFVFLDALPLNPNGKVDRKALPAPERMRPAGQEYVAPRTAAEELLAGIWAGVLGVERVGVEDDFFELGGDSILSIQVVARASRAGLRISPRDVFTHPTVGRLAATAAESAASAAAEEAPVAAGPVPLTPIQRWFLAAEPADPHHFNQAVLLKPIRPLDPGRLQAALDHLLAHHDALRLRFAYREGSWGQEQTGPGGSVPLDLVDLPGAAGPARDTALAAAAQTVQAGLDLTAGPLLRAALLRLADGEERLLLVCHHLVVDGVSWRILLEDLETVYSRLGRGEAAGLPAKTTAYARWAERLAEHATSPDLRRELAHWLADGSAPRLPVDLPGEPAENTVASARVVSVWLDAAETRSLLQEAPGAYHTRIDDVLLAALLRTFERWTGESELRLDLEGHGREDVLDGVDLSRTVGWFTTIFPVQLSSAGAGEPGELLQEVKEQLRRIPLRGFGYGLLRHLGAEPERQALAALPAAEVGFNYLGQFREASPEEALFCLAPEPAGRLYSPRQSRRHLLEIDGVVVDGRLRLDWTWSEAFHRRATVEALATGMLAELRRLVEHCLAPGAGGWTPSDFPLARLGRKRLDALAAAAGGHGEIEDVFPLTPAQQGMFFHSLYAPASGVYVVQLSCLLRGALDAEALAQAWRRVFDRHPILRISLFWEGLEEPLQVVHRRIELPLDAWDWRGLPPEEQETRLDSFLAGERHRGFDLGQAPLQRLALLRVKDTLYRLVWTHHHLLMDGWSLALVLKEVFTLYEALQQKRELPGEPCRPFREYVAWLRHQDLAAAEAFWRRALAGRGAPSPLGFGRPAVPARGAGGTGERLLPLAAEPAAGLGALARRRGWTLSTLAHGAWALLASRYSGDEDVVFGTVVSGRPPGLAGVETMVGPFVNTLPVRVRVTPGAALAGWLDELQAGQVELRQVEHTPLVRIQEWCGASKDQPLFESLVAFENYPMDEARTGAGLEVLEVRSLETNNYPLSLAVAPGAPPVLRCLYDRGRFDGAAIERLLRHWARLLEGMAADPDRLLDDLPLLDRAEEEQVLAAWNRTGTRDPRDASLAELFQEQAVRDPEAVAAVWDGASLTYGELHRRANRLARHLRSLGVAPGDFVAFFLERSSELLVAILGILKAGAAYIPLDLDYPPERLAFMLEDTAAPVVVTREGLLPSLPESAAARVLLDADRAAIDRWSDEDLPAAASGDSVAYVMYTSGSTGRPKGIAIPQRAVRSLVCDADYVRLGPADCIAQVSNVSFDASTFEIWGALLNGGRIVGMPKNVVLAPRELAAQIRASGISTLFLTTALFNQVAREVPDAFRPLRTLLFGGQAADPGRVREVLASGPPSRLLHVYGPTETTTYASWFRVESVEPDAATVPIGHPLANAELYVVDRAFRPVPLGITGELWIGGRGLALGYLHRPVATAERFVPHPWSARPGERLYRTGDLVRRREDGALEFVGRMDHQVKIRGFRIEPAEVEIALSAHPGLREVSVVARCDEPGETRLVAYLVGAGGSPPDTAVLREFLRERVPEFMVPAAFVALDALPLDPNGKVDRRALPAPEATREVESSYVAPRTPVEKEIALVWEELLGISPIGIHDDFFALGGHSLLVTRLASRLREAFGVDLSLRTLFGAPTVVEMGRAVLESQMEQEEAGDLAGMLERLRELSPEEVQRFLESGGEGMTGGGIG